MHFGSGEAEDDHGLGALFLHGLHGGAEVQLATVLGLVRIMLRDSGAWRRLDADDISEVHVGWDQFLHSYASWPSTEAGRGLREPVRWDCFLKG